MKATVLCCVLVASFLCSVNTIQLKVDEFPWQVCTENVIKKLFKERYLYYVGRGKQIDLLPYHITNPKTIINTEQSLRGGRNIIYFNYVIETQSIEDFKLVMAYLRRSIFWDEFYSPGGRFLIVTDNISLVKGIFTVLWGWHYMAIYVAVLVVDKSTKTKSLLFTSNPNNVENGCGLTPNVLQNQTCDSSITDTIPRVVRNYNGCSVTVVTQNPINAKVNRRGLTFLTAEQVLNVSVVTYEEVLRGDKSIAHLTFQDAVLHQSAFYRDRIGRAYEWDTLVWIVPPVDGASSLKILIITFDKEVWILVIVAFVLFAAVWYCLNRCKVSLCGICLDTTSLTLFSSTTLIPDGSALRFMVMCYIIYGIHIQTAYLTDLTRLLISPPKGQPIQNLDELLVTNMPICSDMASSIAILTFRNPKKQKTLQKIGARECPIKNDNPVNLLAKWYAQKNFSLALFGNTMRLVALHLRKPTPDYFIDHEISPLIGKMFTPATFPYLMDSFDVVIEKLIESGLYHRVDMIQKRNVDVFKHQMLSEIDQEKEAMITLEHLHGVFLIFSVGLALSFAVFIGEIVIRRFVK